MFDFYAFRPSRQDFGAFLAVLRGFPVWPSGQGRKHAARLPEDSRKTTAGQQEGKEADSGQHDRTGHGNRKRTGRRPHRFPCFRSRHEGRRQREGRATASGCPLLHSKAAFQGFRFFWRDFPRPPSQHAGKGPSGLQEGHARQLQEAPLLALLPTASGLPLKPSGFYIPRCKSGRPHAHRPRLFTLSPVIPRFYISPCNFHRFRKDLQKRM